MPTENNLKNLNTKVADVKSKNKNGTNRQELLKISQSGDQIFLIPSPNEFDKTAVKVMSEPLNEQLGWLDSSLSEEMFNWIKEGNDYKAKIVEIIETNGEDKSLECRVNITKIQKNKIPPEEKEINLEYEKTLENEKIRSEVNPRSPIDILIYKMHKAAEKMNISGCLLILVILVSILIYLLI